MTSKLVIAILSAVARAGCSGTTGGVTSLMNAKSADDDAAQGSIETVEGHRKIGKPYKVGGRWYTPAADEDYNKVGKASWYGPGFHGKKTANGEIFDQNRLTAAHPTLPLPSYVRVTNKSNNKSLVLRLNDRGPFSRNRIIDVSKRAAQDLGFKNAGHAKVRVEYLGPAPKRGGDRETLAAAKKFGTKPNTGSGIGKLIPSFGGKQNDDSSGVQVRLASKDEEKPRRSSQRQRPIPGIPQREEIRVAAAPSTSVAATSAVSAYRSEAPKEEDPITPLLQMAAAQAAPVSVSTAMAADEPAPKVEPVSEETVAQSGERVGGALAMFGGTQ